MKLIKDLEIKLCGITGFDAVSLQPNSGAQGEYAGLLVIREYFKSRNEQHRNICLIPSSAHGTNPASAVMAGFQVVVVNCDLQGNIDVQDLKLKANLHAPFGLFVADGTPLFHQFGLKTRGEGSFSGHPSPHFWLFQTPRVCACRARYHNPRRLP